jgi:peptidoglycan pentaglycine glycine transferase (the first glycine)
MTDYRTRQPSPEEWDSFVRQHPRGHLLQLSGWGVLKADYGWQPIRTAISDSTGSIRAGAQILLRQLPFKLGTLAYLPYAPLVNWSDSEQVGAVMSAIDQTAQQHRAVFLKVEAGHSIEAEWLRGLTPSPQTVQPPATIILDLDNEESVLARMNQGTRRNIRKSEKFEVRIREGSREDVASFNAMLDETGRRQDFGVHVASYYQRAYDLFVPKGDAVLLMGSYDGIDLAGVFVFKLGKQAWYLYGASRDAERQRMAPYGVQWTGIQWAMAQGCTTYDLYGIPDESEETLEAHFETRRDGLWSVYRFKRGWGGRVARTVGAWDRVYKRPLYMAYQLFLKFRASQTE